MSDFWPQHGSRFIVSVTWLSLVGCALGQADPSGGGARKSEVHLLMTCVRPPVRLIFELTSRDQSLEKTWLDEFAKLDPQRSELAKNRPLDAGLFARWTWGPPWALVGLPSPLSLSATPTPTTPSMALLWEQYPPLSLTNQSALRLPAAALFRLLDTDRDNRLTTDECRHADKRLARRDFNADQVWSREELAELPSQSRLGEARTDAPILLLPTDLSAQRLATELAGRFDQNRDGQLSENEVGLASPAAATSSPESALTPAALWSQYQAATIVRIRAEFSGGPLGIAKVIGVDVSPRQASSRTRSRLTGGFEHRWPELVLTVQATPRRRAAEGLLPPFAQLDEDNDGKLSATEAAPALLPVAISLLDANQDGQVDPQEWLATSIRWAEQRFLRAVIDFSYTRSDLFGAIDTDESGTLSESELAETWKSIATFDLDADGTITPNELRGRLAIELGQGLTARDFPLRGRREDSAPREPKTDIAWFNALDRNSDGWVSAVEYPGSPEQFSKLDRNGDGRLSIAEAEAIAATGP